jgi:hypothetical protein
MRRRQRGHLACPSTSRPGSSVVQAAQCGQRAACFPGGIGTALPQEEQSTSGASTNRTAWPQEGQVERSPFTRRAAPQDGQGVVAAGTRHEPGARA